MKRRSIAQLYRSLLLSLAAISLAIPASISGAVATANEAGAYYVPIWDWNIFGTCGGGNCGSTYYPSEDPVSVLSFLVAATASSERPWTISLNEVCTRQYLYIFAALNSLGYDGVFGKSDGTPGVPAVSPIPNHPFRAVNCGTGSAMNGQFGNATFFLGVKSGSEGRHYFAEANQVDGGDVRNVLCVAVNTFVGLRQECTTHLDPNGNPANPGAKQIAQDNSAAFIAGVLSNSNLTTLAGDRNMTVWGPYTSLGFTEIDIQSPKQRTHSVSNLNHKIDWIWGGAGHVISGTNRYCPPNSHYSDHCMLHGRFWVW